MLKQPPVLSPLIRILPNGPYLVSGRVSLSEQIIVIDENGEAAAWRTGRRYRVQNTYSLCRCGRSGARPFCDGTHTRTGFEGTETASRAPYLEQSRLVEGPELDLTDADALCASARFCDRGEGTWKLTLRSKRPEARQLAIEEAGLCPSGRLVAWSKEGGAIEPRFRPSIGLVEDPQAGVSGPIWVRGLIPIESAGGVPWEIRNRVTLCRCGRSQNMPFCDGSHLPGS